MTWPDWVRAIWGRAKNHRTRKQGLREANRYRMVNSEWGWSIPDEGSAEEPVVEPLKSNEEQYRVFGRREARPSATTYLHLGERDSYAGSTYVPEGDSLHNLPSNIGITGSPFGNVTGICDGDDAVPSPSSSDITTEMQLTQTITVRSENPTSDRKEKEVSFMSMSQRGDDTRSTSTKKFQSSDKSATTIEPHQISQKSSASVVDRYPSYTANIGYKSQNVIDSSEVTGLGDKDLSSSPKYMCSPRKSSYGSKFDSTCTKMSEVAEESGGDIHTKSISERNSSKSQKNISSSRGGTQSCNRIIIDTVNGEECNTSSYSSSSSRSGKMCDVNYRTDHVDYQNTEVTNDSGHPCTPVSDQFLMVPVSPTSHRESPRTSGGSARSPGDVTKYSSKFDDEEFGDTDERAMVETMMAVHASINNAIKTSSLTTQSRTGSITNSFKAHQLRWRSSNHIVLDASNQTSTQHDSSDASGGIESQIQGNDLTQEGYGEDVRNDSTATQEPEVEQEVSENAKVKSRCELLANTREYKYRLQEFLEGKRLENPPTVDLSRIEEIILRKCQSKPVPTRARFVDPQMEAIGRNTNLMAALQYYAVEATLSILEKI